MYVTDTKVSKHFSCKLFFTQISGGGLKQRFLPLEEVGEGRGVQTIANAHIWKQTALNYVTVEEHVILKNALIEEIAVRIFQIHADEI